MAARCFASDIESNLSEFDPGTEEVWIDDGGGFMLAGDIQESSMPGATTRSSSRPLNAERRSGTTSRPSRPTAPGCSIPPTGLPTRSTAPTRPTTWTWPSMTTSRPTRGGLPAERHRLHGFAAHRRKANGSWRPETDFDGDGGTLLPHHAARTRRNGDPDITGDRCRWRWGTDLRLLARGAPEQPGPGG